MPVEATLERHVVSKYPELLIKLGFVQRAANEDLNLDKITEHPPSREERLAALKSEYYYASAGPVPHYTAVRPCTIFPHGFITVVDEHKEIWQRKCTDEGEYDSTVLILKQNGLVPSFTRKRKGEPE